MDKRHLTTWESSKNDLVSPPFLLITFVCVFTLKLCHCRGLGGLFDCLCLPFQVHMMYQMILFPDLKCWCWFFFITIHFWGIRKHETNPLLCVFPIHYLLVPSFLKAPMLTTSHAFIELSTCYYGNSIDILMAPF